MIFWREPGWENALLEILQGYNPVLVDREYYIMDKPVSINTSVLPQGYDMRFVDAALFMERNWKNNMALQIEMCSERSSVEDFLKHSFGVCAVHGDEIAGWCLSEYNNSKGCEVGIEVMEEHQRKGIGTALTQALAAEAFRQGLQRVGWSCYKDNLPSAATARKAGFSKAEDYKAIIVRR